MILEVQDGTECRLLFPLSQLWVDARKGTVSCLCLCQAPLPISHDVRLALFPTHYPFHWTVEKNKQGMALNMKETRTDNCALPFAQCLGKLHRRVSFPLPLLSLGTHISFRQIIFIAHVTNPTQADCGRIQQGWVEGEKGAGLKAVLLKINASAGHRSLLYQRDQPHRSGDDWGRVLRAGLGWM